MFAAASLKTALDEMRPLIQRDTGVGIRVSYAASSALAQQIAAGAPAGIFISADTDWMAYLLDRGLVQRDTVVELVRNRLVLIAPVESRVVLSIKPGFRLREALGTEARLAIAEPNSVPAGKYAKAALTSLGVWDAVSARLAPGENVRVALQFVARAECPLGIVYQSDAVAEPLVRVVDIFPESSHAPIAYPAALPTSATGESPRKVLAWLQTAFARKIFAKAGFVVSDR